MEFCELICILQVDCWLLLVSFQCESCITVSAFCENNNIDSHNLELRFYDEV